MNLRTENYYLRCILQEDLSNVFKGLSDPQVIKYYGVSYKTIEETQAQLDWFQEIETQRTGCWRAICSQTDNSFCGAIGYNYWREQHRRAEIGFWLLKPFWGQGIIKEILPPVLEYGLNVMNLHRIEAEVESENLASSKLLLSNGFLHEGRKQDCEIKNGRFISLDLYAKLKT